MSRPFSLSRASDSACPECHGDGVVTRNPAYPDIRGEIEVRCPTCHGLGTVDAGGSSVFGAWVWAEDPYDQASDACAVHYFETGEHLVGCPHARPRYPRIDVRRSDPAASNQSAHGDLKASLLQGLEAPADPSTERNAA